MNKRLDRVCKSVFMMFTANVLAGHMAFTYTDFKTEWLISGVVVNLAIGIYGAGKDN